jgi:fructokinase
MPETSFLVVGEALVDLIGEPGTWRFEAAPGGSPLNVAAGLAAAGHRVRLVSELGDDLFGGLVRGYLARYGVDRSGLVTTGAPTSLAVARLDETGAAGYDFRFGWTLPGPVRLDGVDCLHVGSLGAVVGPGASTVRDTVVAARRRGILVSYDPNVRPDLMGKGGLARIEELVTLAGFVKVSQDDLAWLYPGTSDLDAVAGWARPGPWLVVITRGRDGAAALYRGEVIECPAPAVEVVDTVGAGDAFTAGLLSSLARAGGRLAEPSHAAVEQALRHATAVAAAVCAHRGAAPADPETVRALAAS